MTDVNENEGVDAQVLLEYVGELESERDELRTENRGLRRRVGAFRANATRRNAGTNDLRTENVRLTEENATLTRSIRAYKANATRRANRG